MSSDKRRRARIQGGWASNARPPKSDDNKPKMATVPAWVGKNSADPPPKDSFVFEQPEEPIMSKPKEQTIEKSGVYDISTEPDGVSRLRLFPAFIAADDCSWMHDQLLQELPWKNKVEMKDDREYSQPRLTAWYGDLPYSYSGITHQANTQWPPILEMLRDRLEEVTGFRYNSVLGNLYRDGHDHVPWHSDDEPGLRRHPTIASLSLGDSRMFELRKKPPLAERAPGDFSPSEVIRVPLDTGTLLIMEGSTQEDWQHRIPKEYHDRKSRINLTFRVIYPEP